MGECLSTSVGQINKRPENVRIRVVSNGYMIEGDYNRGTMIANTLPEALELARKSLE